MNSLTRKLRSGKGASITFGLLLFLVCAVLSSVILVAATTAAGRMAGIAETDQRYYSVTSACGLIKELVDGKSASVVTIDADNDALDGKYVFDVPAYEVDNNSFNVSEKNKTVFGEITRAAAYEYSQTNDWDDDNAGKLGTFKLTSNVPNKNKNGTDPLEVEVEAKVDQDGNILVAVNSGGFSQHMLFSGTVMDDSTSVTQDSNIKVEGQPISLKWTLTSVVSM